MGRRAVVEKTRSSRQAVVVREGRDRRSLIDRGLGIAGGLIFLLAIILVPLLPDDEPVPDQYQVTYEVVMLEDAGTTATLQEGETADLPFMYDGTGLFGLALDIEWTDDVGSSTPDRFSMVLLDPDGEERWGPEAYGNPHPVATGNELAPTYEAQTFTRSLIFQNATRPTTQVITAEPGQELADIEAIVADQLAVGGAGEWILRVTLEEVGGCPDPFTFDPARVADCQASGPDEGNDFTLAKITVTEYISAITLLGS